MKKNFTIVLQQMAKDKIPNIRLNVAKTILQMRKRSKENGGSQDNLIEQDLL